MINRNTTLMLLSLASLLFFSGQVTAQNDEKKDNAEPTRVYRLGNSHTNSVREEFVGLVGAIGHPFKHGQHTVPGAPIWWLFDRNPGESMEDLKNNPWDVVIFQTYNSTTDNEKQSIAGYVKAAQEGNPDVRVILYTIWPRDKSLTLLPGDEWFNEEDLAEEWGRYEGWTEEVAEYLKGEFPDLNVAVAPTSLVIRMIGGLADAGLIPAMQGYDNLTQDAGHMGLYGGYAIGCTFAAMIWDESPIGYPHQMLEQNRRDGGFTEEVALEVDPDAALAMQKVVWDILAEYEKDNLDTGLWINAGRMIPALVGKNYDRPIPVVNAAGDVKFEVTAGELPAGLSLQGGNLVGTPSDTGLSEFTVKADDGTSQVERQMVLAVEKEVPLSVPPVEHTLKADEYIQEQLETEGAIGKASWKLVEGELPAGLILLPSGLVKGTPAEEGDFSVTVEASDRHPEGARTAQGQLKIEVGPPSEGTVIVPLVDLTVDSNEPLEGQNLDQLSFDHQIKDTEGNVVAEFALAAYPGDERFREKRPTKFQDLIIAARIKEENSMGYPMESIHIHMDTDHTREVIYNEDDEHWVIPKGGRRDLVQGYRPQRILRSRTEETEGGWIFAATHSMPSGFGVHHIDTPVTYGFNVAVGSKDDPEQRYYWRGDSSTVKDTSNFGSILIPEITAETKVSE